MQNQHEQSKADSYTKGREQASEVIDAAKDAAKDTAEQAKGLTGLIFGSVAAVKDSLVSGVQHAVESAAHAVEGVVSTASDTLHAASEGLTHATSDMIHTGMDTASAAASTATAAASSATAKATDMASSATHMAADMAASATQKAKDMGSAAVNAAAAVAPDATAKATGLVNAAAHKAGELAAAGQEKAAELVERGKGVTAGLAESAKEGARSADHLDSHADTKRQKTSDASHAKKSPAKSTKSADATEQLAPALPAPKVHVEGPHTMHGGSSVAKILSTEEGHIKDLPHSEHKHNASTNSAPQPSEALTSKNEHLSYAEVAKSAQ